MSPTDRKPKNILLLIGLQNFFLGDKKRIRAAEFIANFCCFHTPFFVGWLSFLWTAHLLAKTCTVKSISISSLAFLEVDQIGCQSWGNAAKRRLSRRLIFDRRDIPGFLSSLAMAASNWALVPSCPGKDLFCFGTPKNVKSESSKVKTLLQLLT